MMKDPYQVLGVARTATATEIKDAYRKLARVHHPDSDPGNIATEDRFKDISAAYDMLSDPERRRAFDMDQVLNKGGVGGNARGAFDRFFRQRQSRGQTQGGKNNAKVQVDGTDITYSITIDFLEAVCGVTRRISMAGGKNLDVTIPPGTEDGQTLRLKGRGMRGIGGGAPGDALIDVAVLPHPGFRRLGHDIHADVPITIDEAVLGAKITVPTAHGPLQVNIPKGANTGTQLRLKDKGVPAGTTTPAGHHYLHLKVILPEKTDSAFADFIRDWTQKNPYSAKRDDKG